MPVSEALTYANAAGARNVTVQGPMEGAGSRAELDDSSPKPREAPDDRSLRNLARRGAMVRRQASHLSAQPIHWSSAPHPQRCTLPDTLVIEATCNQVNQFGGYTGMLPDDFVGLVETLLRKNSFRSNGSSSEATTLGQIPGATNMPAQAMAKAEEMVEAYVSAGFRRSTSTLRWAAPASLPRSTTPQRRSAPHACAAAERAASDAGGEPPVYIIGTEVPPPAAPTMRSPHRADQRSGSAAHHRHSSRSLPTQAWPMRSPASSHWWSSPASSSATTMWSSTTAKAAG